MLKKNTNIVILAAFALLSALFASGCSRDAVSTISPADTAKRIAIIQDKTLTDDQREDKLADLYNAEQPSPFGPIMFGLGALALVFVVRFVKQRNDEAKAQRLIEQKKAQKIAEAKAAYEAAKTPKRVNKRPVQAATATGAATSGPLDLLADEEDLPKVKVALSQTAVNALPPSERGVSFFTSRPAPKESLNEMTIAIGDRFRLVWATPEEADAIDVGRIPLVRAFTYRRKTLPWYEGAGYDPYVHYWPAVAHDWLWMGGKVTASWLGVERANPSMPGYNGNKTSNKLDWERVTRPARPGKPAERLLSRCTNIARFHELKRRKQPRATRSIGRGRHMPPLAIPSRPLKLHKRRVKRVVNERHVFLEL